MNNIQVIVQTRYIEEQSRPEQDYFVYSYTVTLINKGDQPARLLSRHWVITDSNQRVQEVRGEGVVGEKPYLKPGEQYTYSSGTMLETEVGTMRGSYQMIGDDGEQFDAAIDEFVLAPARVLH